MKQIKLSYLWMIGLIFITLSFLFHYTIFEFFGVMIIGFAINGLPLEKKTKLFKFVVVTSILAMFFDPVLKPYLDKVGFNTVPTLSLSILLNGLLLVIFLGSYHLAENLIKHKYLEIKA